MARKIYFLGLFLVSFLMVGAQHNHDHSGHDHSGHDHSGHDHAAHDHSAHGHDSHGTACGSHDGEYDPAATAIHHISDANVFSILDAVRIPLPMMLKSDAGWDLHVSYYSSCSPEQLSDTRLTLSRHRKAYRQL